MPLYCPNCSYPLELGEMSCPLCGAFFGKGAAWLPLLNPPGPIPTRPPRPIAAALNDLEPQSEAAGSREPAMAAEASGNAASDSATTSALAVAGLVFGIGFLIAFWLHLWNGGTNPLDWSKSGTQAALLGIGWIAGCVLLLCIDITVIRRTWLDAANFRLGAMTLSVVALLAMLIPLHVGCISMVTYGPLLFDRGRANKPLFDAACRGDEQAVRGRLSEGLSAKYQRNKADAGGGDALEAYFRCLPREATGKFNRELVDALVSAGASVNPKRTYPPPPDPYMRQILEKIRVEDRAEALTYFAQKGRANECIWKPERACLRSVARRHGLSADPLEAGQAHGVG